MFDSKELLSKCRPVIEKLRPFAPLGKTMLPVLVTGLIMLGCVEAPAMQQIPELLQPSDVQSGESMQGALNGSTVSPGTGSQAGSARIGSGSAGSTSASAASVGNAAARTQVSYTKPVNGYKDGTYTGSATGFGGPINVKVTISGGKITNITITSAAKEDAQFLQMARNVIPKIISAQTPNVDAVSGATYSSNGIINAVKNALSKAGNTSYSSSGSSSSGGNGSASPSGTNDPSPSNNDQQNNPSGSQNQDNPSTQPAGPSTGNKYADGTYTGSATGFGGTVKTQIIVKDGKMTSITVLSADKETPSYLTFAKPVIDRMLEKQSTDVDVVAGATYTSRAIINGVKEALNKAAAAVQGQTGQSDNKDTNQNSDPAPSDQPTDPQPGNNPAPSDQPTDPQPGDNPDNPAPSDQPTDPQPGDKPDNPAPSDQPTDPQPGDNPDNPAPSDQPTDPQPGVNPDDPTPSDQPDQPEQPAKKYKDGTYNGTADAWGGKIKVNVKFENDLIKTITISSAVGETPAYLESARAVIKKIINKQSTEVDTVTGATYSSRGIINAVKAALQTAADAAAEEAWQAQEAQQAQQQAEQQPEQQVPSTYYEDGEYTGTANGWGGSVTVKVTIKDGIMSAISIISADNETPSYLKTASKVTTKMLQKKTADVDVITGATYTSRAIINGVKQALQKAERTIDNGAVNPSGGN